MRWFHSLVLLLLLLFFPTTNSRAESMYTHGIALFGELKYAPDFKHFEYVNPQAPKGGDIRLATVGSFDNLNPFILKGISAAGVSLVFDSLLTTSLDETDTAYGLIAESVRVSEDLSSVIFYINKAAQWHDGTQITADDVVFTFETLIQKGHPSYRLLYSDVQSVSKLSMHEVEFKIANTSNRKLPLLIGQMSIISKAYFEEFEFGKTTLKPIMGSGPYRIERVDAGRSIRYERVDNYWGKSLPVNIGRYNFKHISWDYFRDRTIMVEAFKAGEFDWHEEFTSKTWMTAYNLPATGAGMLIKEVLPDNLPSGVQAFFINTRRDKFSDIRVRKALSFAFDYEWTNKKIFYGLYTRMASYFENSELAARGVPEGAELDLLETYRGQIPDELFTNEFLPPSTDGSGRNRKNLSIASKLLKAAGWHLKHGKRINEKSNEKLSIEVLYFSPTFERVFGPYARNLEKLGISVDLRLVDLSQYVKRLEDHDFDITTRRFVQQLSPGAELWNYFGSSAADERGTLNSAGISDPVVDDLIIKILSAPSRLSMKNAAKALDRVLLWGHYIVPQWYKGSHNLVYWNKFSRPDMLPKYALTIDNWWLDEDKLKKLKTFNKSSK